MRITRLALFCRYYEPKWAFTIRQRLPVDLIGNDDASVAKRGIVGSTSGSENNTR